MALKLSHLSRKIYFKGSFTGLPLISINQGTHMAGNVKNIPDVLPNRTMSNICVLQPSLKSRGIFFVQCRKPVGHIHGNHADLYSPLMRAT